MTLRSRAAASYSIRVIAFVLVALVGSATLAQDVLPGDERLSAAETRIAELEAAVESLTAASVDAERSQSSSASSSKADKPTENESEKKSESKDAKKKHWYEKYTIRGYTQVRFNQETVELENSAPAQHVGDRSVGDDQSFSIRRARLILQGDINEYASLYFQPDFANTPTGSTDQTFFGQIRDAYADLYLHTDKVHRFRVGQSKVPYGWENMQSSSNRLPLDRAEGTNSSFRNERDLGVIYYYTPKPAQDFFKNVIDEGLKGSGNYGMFSLGVVNGQGGSQLEQNNNLHVVSRLTIPYRFCNGQYMESSIHGYVGEYVVQSAAIRPLGIGPQTFRPAGSGDTGNANGWSDRRIGTTWVWYPQPIGFQTEWNWGRSPALNAAQTAIEDRSLFGGYAMTMAKIDSAIGLLYPFARWSYHRGGLKNERNAPYAMINEWEIGQEWQIHTAAELTASYLITDRTNTNAGTDIGVAPYQQFRGQVLRLQLQFNY
ncbi:MAG: porin [Pirellulales bacterium]